jgi:radical SAM-linked protein
LKARIKFRKYGVLKFLGHLDVMRFFQKAMRRADIPIAFTSGYSPHMIMSFAQPLGLGITSEGEYLDIELAEPISSADALSRLNQTMAAGIDVVSFRQIQEDKKSSGMTIVAAAEYLVLPKEAEDTALKEHNRTEPVFPTSWSRQIDAFLAQPELVVLKKTKRSEKEVDIKPMIYDFHMEPAGICLKLAAGSEANLKPELVMETFLSFINEKESKLHYHRMEIYAKNPDAEGPEFVPLEALGWEMLPQ